MPEHHSNTTLAAAADLLRQAQGTIYITTHAKPDGDAFGSVVALASALHTLGKQTFACFAPPVAASLLDLNGNHLTRVLDDNTAVPDCALYVVLDTGAWAQVEPMRATIEPNLQRTLILDHHLSGDIDAAHKYVDANAAACAEIVAELLDLLAVDHAFQWDATVAQALFVGIGSDTGWFRFSNTRPYTHRLAARLLELGVDHADLYARLHQTERPAKLALLTRALDSLKLVAEGRAAIMHLTLGDFDETGALQEETERLIDVPQQVGTIQVVALVTESTIDTSQGEQPLARISFRSKPGPNAVNVADLAGELGGGGHARAAGAKLQAPLEEAMRRVTQIVSAAFSGRLEA